jgi:type IX secretion system PorP/SprF family membrane protein
MRKLFIILLLLLSFFYKAQDFLPFQNHQLLNFINPSFAGCNGSIRTQNFSAGSQFFRSQGLSVDAFNPSKNAGYGLVFNNHSLLFGDLITRSLAFNFAKQFLFIDENWKIIPSIGLEWMVKSFDIRNLAFGQRPPVIVTNRAAALSINSGLLIQTTNFYFGASLFQINRPAIDFFTGARLPIRLVLYSSYYKVISAQSKLNINFRVDAQRSMRSSQIMLNYFNHSPIFFGVGYTNNLAIFSVGLKSERWSTSLLYSIPTIRFASYLRIGQLTLSYSLSGSASPLLNFEER